MIPYELFISSFPLCFANTTAELRLRFFVVILTLIVVLKNISKTVAFTGDRRSRKNYPFTGGEFA